MILAFHNHRFRAKTTQMDEKDLPFGRLSSARRRENRPYHQKKILNATVRFRCCFARYLVGRASRSVATTKRRAIRKSGGSVADATAVADADVATVAEADVDQMLDLAELRALETARTAARPSGARLDQGHSADGT